MADVEVKQSHERAAGVAKVERESVKDSVAADAAKDIKPPAKPDAKAEAEKLAAAEAEAQAQHDAEESGEDAPVEAPPVEIKLSEAYLENLDDEARDGGAIVTVNHAGGEAVIPLEGSVAVSAEDYVHLQDNPFVEVVD